ncbi:MAG: hypothetical protein ABIR27_00840 [Dokdonella sp.]
MIQVSARRLATLMATTLLVAGCASQSAKTDLAPGKGDPEAAAKIVNKRSIERWELLIAHKADKAYDYLSPGFKATKKREDYTKEMSDRPVEWQKVLPYSQVCDKPDVCVVNIQVDANVKMPGVGKRVSSVGFVTETWIRTHGKWYFLPDSKKITGRK